MACAGPRQARDDGVAVVDDVLEDQLGRLVLAQLDGDECGHARGVGAEVGRQDLLSGGHDLDGLRVDPAQRGGQPAHAVLAAHAHGTLLLVGAGHGEQQVLHVGNGRRLGHVRRALLRGREEGLPHGTAHTCVVLGEADGAQPRRRGLERCHKLTLVWNYGAAQPDRVAALLLEAGDVGVRVALQQRRLPRQPGHAARAVGQLACRVHRLDTDHEAEPPQARAAMDAQGLPHKLHGPGRRPQPVAQVIQICHYSRMHVVR